MKALRSVSTRRRSRYVRVYIELAERPLAVPPSVEVVPGTYRKTPWRGARLEIRPDRIVCNQAAGVCKPISDLLTWAGGRCPEYRLCAQWAEDNLLVEGQKMVDTMIVSDSIVAHVANGADTVWAVSMDDDVVPGIISVRGLGGDASLVRFGRVNPSVHDPLLVRIGIGIVDYPRLGS